MYFGGMVLFIFLYLVKLLVLFMLLFLDNLFFVLLELDVLVGLFLFMILRLVGVVLLLLFKWFFFLERKVWLFFLKFDLSFWEEGCGILLVILLGLWFLFLVIWWLVFENVFGVNLVVLILSLFCEIFFLSLLGLILNRFFWLLYFLINFFYSFW